MNHTLDLVKVCEKMIALADDIRLVDPAIKKAMKYPALNEIKFEGANFVSETFATVQLLPHDGSDDILNMRINILFVKSELKLANFRVCAKLYLPQNDNI